jgi:ketosteroid isomerase-like protein
MSKARLEVLRAGFDAFNRGDRGRGRTSGASVSSRIYSVWTIRAGKIARYREFYDERAALEAVGLAQ